MSVLVHANGKIKRLKSVIRGYRQMLKAAPHINYHSLYETWADFDDAEAPDEVVRPIDHSGLRPVDAVSFNAFCYGYERGVRKIRGRYHERYGNEKGTGHVVLTKKGGGGYG
jgi:hypothetical protein